MLYSEIIAVCSQIHTKHINTLCEQNVGFVLNMTVDQVPMWDLWWQLFVSKFFSPSRQCHSTNAPYSFFRHWRCVNLATDSVVK